MTTAHETTTRIGHTAAEVRMSGSPYVVVFVPVGEESEVLSRAFSTQLAAVRWARWLLEGCATLARVTLGVGGVELTRFAAQ